ATLAGIEGDQIFQRQALAGGIVERSAGELVKQRPHRARLLSSRITITASTVPLATAMVTGLLVGSASIQPPIAVQIFPLAPRVAVTLWSCPTPISTAAPVM